MDKALKALLDWWEEAGVNVPDMPPAKPKPRASQSIAPQTAALQQAAPSAPPAAPSPAASALAQSAKTLAELKTAMEGFDAGALSDGATQCVFSRGNPESDIMVIGEAPGRDEDIQGKPFVGRSGQLLDKMFASIGLSEDDFYITNVINWRPPNNRNPKPEEIALCRPFLDRHIELMNPKVMVIVGGVSLTAMTGLTGIMKNRGQWQTLTIGGRDIPALPIYHPAFLLRQPAMKKHAWRDLLSLRARLSEL